MGRPLFSYSFRDRTEPSRVAIIDTNVLPSAHPYEKWSAANAFDPDSDEFFQRDDVVYEAFLDQDDRPLSEPELSSEGSESSSSGRGTPMDTETGHTDVSSTVEAVLEGPRTGETPFEALRRLQHPSAYESIIVAPRHAVRPLVEDIHGHPTEEPGAGGRRYRPGEMVAQFGAVFDLMVAESNSNSSSSTPAVEQIDPTDTAVRTMTRQALHAAVSRANAFLEEEGHLTVASVERDADDDDDDDGDDDGDDDDDDNAPPDMLVYPMTGQVMVPVDYIPRHSRTRPRPIRANPIRPSTPPNAAAVVVGTPSPPTTPRHLYTWPHTAASPLPNPSARMSLAHIAPPSPMHVIR